MAEPTTLDYNAVVEELNREPLSRALLERAQYAVVVKMLQERLGQRDDEIARLRAQLGTPEPTDTTRD